ncbi:MAG: hypothetical protein EBT35_09340 [Alphaproteobacteria bacterium]|nr:hypothetical protein [Alphaproteobacteria bacterium]
MEEGSLFGVDGASACRDPFCVSDLRSMIGGTERLGRRRVGSCSSRVGGSSLILPVSYPIRTAASLVKV